MNKKNKKHLESELSYIKVVAWSQEDQCFVGTAPGLIVGGVHGDDEQSVFKELSIVVAEAISLYKKHGKALPPATAGKKYNGKILLRLSPNLHNTLAIEAMTQGDSLNHLIVKKLSVMA